MVRMESEMEHIYRAIEQLAQYGIYNGLIEKEDKIFVINQLLELCSCPAMNRSRKPMQRCLRCGDP